MILMKYCVHVFSAEDNTKLLTAVENKGIPLPEDYGPVALPERPKF